MVYEYAITPDVFAPSTYESPIVCDLRLTTLKEGLLKTGLLRDLHDGEWQKGLLATSNRDNLHSRGKELLKKMVQQGRLCIAPAVVETLPSADAEWCQEALISHGREALTGIITSPETKSEFAGAKEITSIEKLSGAQWWKGTQSSIELQRCIDDYLDALRLILCRSRSLMFIDPHLDPRQTRYGDFFQLLNLCKNCPSPPQIELHRVNYSGSGKNRKFYDNAELEDMFRSTLKIPLAGSNLKVEVFVWDEIHDRYLISNLIGITLPNGFDVDGGTASTTRWGRLESKERDSVQREFDSATGAHSLLHRFVV